MNFIRFLIKIFFRKEIDELEKNIEKARVSQNYVVIEPQVNNELYAYNIAEFGDNKYLKWLLYLAQQNAIANLQNAPEEHKAYWSGVMHGVNKITEAIKTEKENKQIFEQNKKDDDNE